MLHLAFLVLGITTHCERLPCSLSIDITATIAGATEMALDTSTPDPRFPEVQLVRVTVVQTGGVFPVVDEQYLVTSTKERVVFALWDNTVEVDVPLGALALRVTPGEDAKRLVLAVVRSGWLPGRKVQKRYRS